MNIGDIFYIHKDEWSARGSDDKYNEIVIQSDGGKVWKCENGTINKRSKRYRHDWGRETAQIFTQLEMELKEFSRKHRHKVVRTLQYCTPDILKQIADLIGYEEEQ